MMIDVHLPDEALAKLATLIAERLSEFNDMKLGEFLQRDPADDPKPALGYPAPPEPPVAIDPTPIDPAPVNFTKDDLTRALVAVGKRRGRGGIEEVLREAGYKAAADVPESAYAKVIGIAREHSV